MRFETLTTGLLIGLLVGCSGTKQDTTVTSTLESQQASKSRVTEPNEFDSVSFPQESCGEKLPNDPKAYPVNYYPVFIDYSEGNLQSVKSKYCRDALKKFRKTIGKDAIQVSSFLSIERAQKFQKFMIGKIGSGEVGEPAVIEAKRTARKNSELNKTDAPLLSQQAIAEAAKLTPDQVEQLVSLDKNNEAGIDFKIIVPTYIPSGFKIEKFEINKYQTGPEYKINYRNLNGSCFGISSRVKGGAGGNPDGYETLVVSSPALGKVPIDYTTSAQAEDNQYIEVFMVPGILQGSHLYSFGSPQSEYEGCNKIISLEEAVKIVESLQYLNP